MTLPRQTLPTKANVRNAMRDFSYGGERSLGTASDSGVRSDARVWPMRADLGLKAA